MLIGVVGVNHKSAGIALRESLAKAWETIVSDLLAGTLKVNHVLVNTCNRTELYFSAMDLENTCAQVVAHLCRVLGPVVQDSIYCYIGGECFYHLARVVSGMDSAVLAETEIQGQVKQAYLNSASQATLR